MMILKTSTVAAAVLAVSGFALAPAMAQDSDDEAVEYEFAFAYDENEPAEAREARLEEEVADYCDGLGTSDSYYCEDELTDAVNAEIEDEDDDEERLALN